MVTQIWAFLALFTLPKGFWHWCRLSILFPSATATIHNNIIHHNPSVLALFKITFKSLKAASFLNIMLVFALRWCGASEKQQEDCKLGALDLLIIMIIIIILIYIYIFIYIYTCTHTHIYIYILLVFCTWNETVLPVWSKLALLIVMVLKTSCSLRGPRIQDIGVPEAYLSW